MRANLVIYKQADFGQPFSVMKPGYKKQMLYLHESEIAKLRDLARWSRLNLSRVVASLIVEKWNLPPGKRRLLVVDQSPPTPESEYLSQDADSEPEGGEE